MQPQRNTSQLNKNFENLLCPKRQTETLHKIVTNSQKRGNLVLCKAFCRRFGLLFWDCIPDRLQPTPFSGVFSSLRTFMPEISLVSHKKRNIYMYSSFSPKRKITKAQMRLQDINIHDPAQVKRKFFVPKSFYGITVTKCVDLHCREKKKWLSSHHVRFAINVVPPLYLGQPRCLMCAKMGVTEKSGTMTSFLYRHRTLGSHFFFNDGR